MRDALLAASLAMDERLVMLWEFPLAPARLMGRPVSVTGGVR